MNLTILHRRRIVQSVQKYITLTPASYTADGSVEQFTFQIESNTSWEVTSMNSWISVDTTNGSNNATVTVSLSENTGTGIRTGNVRVRNVSEGIEKFVGINQEAAEEEPDITINPETYQQDEKARDFSIVVDTLSYWEASINVGWITLSQMTGPAGGVTITASVAVNATGEERTGVITFTTEFGHTTCTVTQTTP